MAPHRRGFRRAQKSAPNPPEYRSPGICSVDCAINACLRTPSCCRFVGGVLWPGLNRVKTSWFACIHNRRRYFNLMVAAMKPPLQHCDISPINVEEFSLHIGGLDPARNLSGVQQQTGQCVWRQQHIRGSLLLVHHEERHWLPASDAVRRKARRRDHGSPRRGQLEGHREKVDGRLEGQDGCG